MSAAPLEQTGVVAAGSTIASVLSKSPLPALEARILVGHSMQLSRVQLITQSARTLTDDEAQRLTALFQRRLTGEPIAYIVGQREFYGLPFHVTPDVLIPRPETELLVELALEHMPDNARLLDLGTGSGAIAVAVAYARPDVAVTALDVSESALAIARRNAALNKVQVAFMQSDWYGALTDHRFDVIVANPPYIAIGDNHLKQGDLRFEPVAALTDHADGLSALRTIVAGAGRYLNAGGWLLMEHGYDQAQSVRELLEEQQFCQVQSWKDLAGIERVSGGAKSA